MAPRLGHRQALARQKQRRGRINPVGWALPTGMLCLGVILYSRKKTVGSSHPTTCPTAIRFLILAPRRLLSFEFSNVPCNLEAFAWRIFVRFPQSDFRAATAQTSPSSSRRHLT